MPRANWKGTIAFGLVSIPVLLYPAENKAADISFHQIDKRDHARIKYQRINVDTGKIVPWEQITRGYEYDKETTVPVPDEVLKKVAGVNARTIDISTFINQSDLDKLTIKSVYYLVPDKHGEKGYVILRTALSETKKIGIAKVIISTKEYLAALMVYEQALVLCLLKYANEMRKTTELPLPDKALTAYKIKKKEIEIAKKLVQSMSSKWRPSNYVDEYQKAIHQWVEQTVKKLPHTSMKQRKQRAMPAVDLIDLLRKSLATKRKVKPRKQTTGLKSIVLAQTKHKTKAKVMTKH